MARPAGCVRVVMFPCPLGRDWVVVTRGMVIRRLFVQLQSFHGQDTCHVHHSMSALPFLYMTWMRWHTPRQEESEEGSMQGACSSAPSHDA